MTFPYHYHQLAPHQIRLLVIEWPKTSAETVSPLFSIVHENLDLITKPLYEPDSSAYAAVSYAWGAPNRSNYLMLKSQHYLLITGSLKAALPAIALQARRNHLYRIWIDQICVNQYDMRERGHQVALMRTVYKRSFATIIWLGEEDEHTKCLIELFDAARESVGTETVEMAGRTIQERVQPASEREQKQDQLVTKERAVRRLLTQNETAISMPTSYELSFLEFFGRPWFHRAWVFQEAVLPRITEFCIGEHSFDPSLILHISDIIGSARLRRLLLESRVNSSAASGYEAFQAMDDARKDYAEERRFGGFEVRDYHYFLSEVAHRCQTSNFRDLCYAFLGFQNNDKIVIHPQYNVSVATVFTNTTRSIIDGTSSLDIFTSINRCESRAALIDLPSWVPDWSAKPQTTSLYVKNNRSLICASYFYIDHSASKLFAHRKVSSGRELRVCGKVIDIISSLHGSQDNAQLPQDVRGADINKAFELDNILKELRQISQNEFWQITPERVLAVLIAEGANAGEAEPIFQHEALNGLAIWRLKELVQTYNSWQIIQANLDKPEYYGALLNARALLAYGQVVKYRRVCTTENWRLGLVPYSAQRGDFVCILHGSKTPVVLRKFKCRSYRVVGQCYVEGVMRGEAVSWKEGEGDEFALV